jgi:hypothetical protein
MTDLPAPTANFSPEDCKGCSGSGLGKTGEGRCLVCNGQGSVLVAQPARPCAYCKGLA